MMNHRSIAVLTSFCCLYLLAGCTTQSPATARSIEHKLTAHGFIDPYVEADEDGVTVVLDGTNITDLSALSGLPINCLVLYGTPITDLSPLQAMPLNALAIDGTRVSDISPLAGKNLEILTLAGTNVRDLSPLRGMQLRSLSFSPMNITNGWDAVRSMDTLELLCDRAPGEFWHNWNGSEPPQSTVQPTMSITGVWSHSDGRYFGTDIQIDSSATAYRVQVHIWGCTCDRTLLMNAQFSNGVLTLDQRIEDAWPLWYQQLYAVRVGNQDYLVPASVAHTIAEELNADNSDFRDGPPAHVLQRRDASNNRIERDSGKAAADVGPTGAVHP